MKDYCLTATAYNGEARIYVSYSKKMAEEARQIHGTWPTASAALGRFLTASAMMGLMYKNEETITLRIEGDGPIGYMITEANSQGEVRGDIKQPEVYLTYNSGEKAGKLAVGKAVGNGFLHVTKDLKLKNMFTSSTQLQTGEIGDDFTYYFTSSEQTPSAVGLGVLVDVDQTIKQAGGFIIQLMPNATEATIVQIEKVLSNIKAITDLYESGLTPEDILDLLSNHTHSILRNQSIKYHCPCSKDKFKVSLSKVDKATIDSMIEEDKGAEIVCHFCHKKYHFDVTELEAIKTL
ncbi:MAG: Hsp33 family molecular chaperone HslO [Acholeplasma sp.]|nr:Hsp33 family molecular chaperone HslO [Acholeplasma sp.]